MLLIVSPISEALFQVGIIMLTDMGLLEDMVIPGWGR